MKEAEKIGGQKFCSTTFTASQKWQIVTEEKKSVHVKVIGNHSQTATLELWQHL